jgi:chemotaxis response regulator CheB
MDHPLRVAVAAQPRLIRELMLETVREQSDIEVVADIQNEADIERIVEESKPDFLIITSELDLHPPVSDALLRRHPAMKILALATDRNRGLLLWASVDIQTAPVETSEAGILAALRGQYTTSQGGLADRPL